MAERRMFAKSVVSSARFLRMPVASRLLYYDLGMEADDDGCVEAFVVMRKTGASENDLIVLVDKGFIRILNDDLVSYILDWNTNNQIRKDRYHESVYKSLINGACIVALSAVATDGLPDGNQVEPEIRVDKSSGDKVSGVEKADKPPKPTHISPPSVDEVRAYCDKRGYSTIDPERFVSYYAARQWMTGNTAITNWQAAVDSWYRKDIGEQDGKIESKPRWTVGTVV